MQTEEFNRCDSESPSARVQDIRRQWALHEDEALAHRLQDEEITQHYAGNRTRNAIVRGDAPHAREEQRREEQDALEQRLKHLSILQKQAEEDARVAQQLAKKYQAASAGEDASVLPCHDPLEGNQDILDMRIGPEVPRSSHYKVDASLLGAACVPCSSSQAKAFYAGDDDVTEEDVRLLQEQKDEELARQVQDELQQYEKDRNLAIEAQDRELAKVLYEKEKARLKRAKERARLKAEAALNGGTVDGPASSDSDSRAVSRNSIDPGEKKSADMKSPPRVPEKSSVSKENFIGFKANPKPLPPQPQQSSSSRRSYSDDDPVPPYMPIHGFNRSSPKRSK